MAFLASAVVLVALAWPLWTSGLLLPRWITWHDDEVVCDLDGDGAPDTLTLEDGRLRIDGGDGASCRVQLGWRVSHAFVGDVTRDGTPEVVLVFWRRGAYGPSMPFWMESNDPWFSQHLGVFDYADGKLRERWVSSDMGFEAREAAMTDDAHLVFTDADGVQTEWMWGSWGIVLADDDNPALDSEAGTAAVGSMGNLVTSDAPQPETMTLTFLAAGDVIAHDTLYRNAWNAEAGEFDFDPVFDHVRGFIGGFDIAAVVQETPFVDDPARYAGFPVFGTPTALGDALANAGFDVVCSATNHAYDQGERGIADTLAFWDAYADRMTVLGIHKTAEDADELQVVERNGISVALLDYTFHLNDFELPAERSFEVDVLGEDRMVDQVGQAEASADLTICFLHIGDEYSLQPADMQRELCQRLADAGADAVICSHPHVLQPAETLEGAGGTPCIVYWSLGNLASNQMFPETVLGGMATLSIAKDQAGTRIADFGLVPTVCHMEGGKTQVRLLSDYNASLADSHFINRVDETHPIDLDRLQGQADDVAAAMP